MSEGSIDINAVLEEKDVFRLVVRGHAAIEEKIDATIQEAVDGATPQELTRLPFRTRLALLCALTGVPPKLASLRDKMIRTPRQLETEPCRVVVELAPDELAASGRYGPALFLPA